MTYGKVMKLMKKNYKKLLLGSFYFTKKIDVVSF